MECGREQHGGVVHDGHGGHGGHGDHDILLSMGTNQFWVLKWYHSGPEDY